MTDGKQIKLGAIISYISIALNIVVGLFYTPWMIKKIGQSQYAIYTLASTLISMFMIDFGLSSAAARFVSNYKAQERQEDINNFLGVIYKLYLIIDAVIFAVLFVYFFFIDSVYVSLTAEEIKQFKVVYIMSATFSLFNMPFVTQTGVITAYSKFILLKLADLIYRVFWVGLMVLALAFGLGLYALVGAHILAGLINILYKHIVIKSCTPVKINFRYRDRTLLKSIFAFSFWTTVSTLAGRLIFTITPTILGVVAGSTDIAVFGVITTLEGFFWTITTAINGMFMPSISKAYMEDKEKAPEKLNMLFLGVGKFNFLLNGLLCVGFFLLGREFVSLWMGVGYEDAYIGILLVTIPGLFYNCLQVANTAMTVDNKVHLQAIISVVCGVVNVGLSFVFSKLYGVIGACISICIAYMLRAVMYHIVHSKVMKFDIKRFLYKCYLRCIPCFVITIVIVLLLKKFFVINSWLSFVVWVAVTAVIYVVLALLLCTSKGEKRLVFDKVGNMFKKKRKSNDE